jgi:hypothetical protein
MRKFHIYFAQDPFGSNRSHCDDILGGQLLKHRDKVYLAACFNLLFGGFVFGVTVDQIGEPHGPIGDSVDVEMVTGFLSSRSGEGVTHAILFEARGGRDNHDGGGNAGVRRVDLPPTDALPGFGT